MESKKILIASAIFNVILVISLSCLAVHYTGKYSAYNKKISEQNKTITEKIDYEKVFFFYNLIVLIKFSNEVLRMQMMNKTLSD